MSSEIKVSSLKAKDGTAGISIADSTGNVSLSGSLSAGILGSSVVFPAGTILQVNTHTTTSTQTNSGGDTDYYFQSDGSIGTGSSSPLGNITLKKANSTLIYTIHGSVYWSRSMGSGNFPSINWYIRYSTNSNLSSPTDTSIIAQTYEDTRWQNYLSEQQKVSASGTEKVTSSHAKDTVVYYTVKVNCRYSAIYPMSLQVMELAT
tara:strand:+ start:3684 stop:4298 length:615 start_codon:yes stop_codon:yes gene_type:complete